MPKLILPQALVSLFAVFAPCCTEPGFRYFVAFLLNFMAGAGRRTAASAYARSNISRHWSNAVRLLSRERAGRMRPRPAQTVARVEDRLERARADDNAVGRLPRPGGGSRPGGRPVGQVVPAGLCHQRLAVAAGHPQDGEARGLHPVMQDELGRLPGRVGMHQVHRQPALHPTPPARGVQWQDPVGRTPFRPVRLSYHDTAIALVAAGQTCPICG